MVIGDMTMYKELNDGYVKNFGLNPPVRVCVESRIWPHLVIIQAIGFAAKIDDPGSIRRKTMHVQGISHWAPANIGPYSQAVQVGIQPRLLN